MKNIFLATAFIFLLHGCLWVNDRGISGKYYNDCKEYYDATSTYHKECDKNLINW